MSKFFFSLSLSSWKKKSWWSYKRILIHEHRLNQFFSYFPWNSHPLIKNSVVMATKCTWSTVVFCMSSGSCCSFTVPVHLTQTSSCESEHRSAQRHQGTGKCVSDERCESRTQRHTAWSCSFCCKKSFSLRVSCFTGETCKLLSKQFVI